MKIQGIEVFVVAVPYIPVIRKYRPKEPYEQPDPIVRIKTDEEIVGIGESGRGGNAQAILQQFRSIIGKDPLELYPDDYESGIMQALYDLQGKALQWPVYRLLGRKVRDRVPVAYWTVERATPEETASEAQVAVQRGFKVMKFHTNPMEETTVARVKAIHEAVGDRIAIRIDRGYPWDLPMAVRIARQLKGYNIECFEDPIPKNDPRLYRLLREKIDIPLAWHIGSARDALLAAKADAVDYLNVSAKPSTVAAISAISEAAGIPLWLQICGVSGTGLLSAFSIHIAAVTKNATLPGDNLHFVREHDLLKPNLEVKEGFVEVPEKPGIGVELDLEAVKRYEIAHYSL
ncbi:MAG: enolase C-terminal domain-like protein [Candidatus Bathyarchaeia archaeon]